MTHDIDHRKAAWHEAARKMKSDGAALKDIAAFFNKSRGAVDNATKGTKSKHGFRRYVGAVSGFKIGTQKRVAISFTDEQVSRINAIAQEQGVSFSLAVAGLVGAALRELEAS